LSHAEAMLNRQAVNEVMDVKGAYQYFNGLVSEWLIRDAARKGMLPSARVGSRVLFRKAALDEWFLEQERKSAEKGKTAC